MHGPGEEAYIAAMKLHVTGNLALIRAAENKLIKNKVGLGRSPCSVVCLHGTINSFPLKRIFQQISLFELPQGMKIAACSCS